MVRIQPLQREQNTKVQMQFSSNNSVLKVWYYHERALCYVSAHLDDLSIFLMSFFILPYCLADNVIWCCQGVIYVVLRTSYGTFLLTYIRSNQFVLYSNHLALFKQVFLFLEEQYHIAVDVYVSLKFLVTA